MYVVIRQLLFKKIRKLKLFKFTFLLLIEVKFSTPLELQHIFEFWIAQCKYPNHFGKKIFPQIQREICSMKLRKCEHNSFQFFNNKRVKERSNSITQVLWCTDTGSLIFFIRSTGPLKCWIECNIRIILFTSSVPDLIAQHKTTHQQTKTY